MKEMIISAFLLGEILLVLFAHLFVTVSYTIKSCGHQVENASIWKFLNPFEKCPKCGKQLI